MLVIYTLIISSLASYLMGNPQLKMHADRPGTPDMVVRENMGVLFQRVATLGNSVSFWSHTIVVTSPDLQDLKVQKSFCDRRVHSNHRDLFTALCDLYQGTFETYDGIRKSLSNEVDEKSGILQQLIPVGGLENPVKVTTTGARPKRAPLEFIGKISRNLFATATLDDVKILRDHISALENDPGRFEGFQKFAESLSSLQFEVNKNMKIVTEGLRRNRILINETFSELDILHHSLEEVMDNVDLQFKLMTQVVNIMHGINAREIHSMFFILSELDKIIDSYSTLLKGYLPIHLITPQRITAILNQVQEYLKANHPSFKVLHKDPAVYYNMPGVITYTKTMKYLYIKFRIPITSSDLLYEVYSIKSIPITTGNSTRVSFTQIRKLPNYLGVTRDNKFFVELDQVDYDSCPGINFKQCSNFLRVFQNSEPTCSSALFMNRLDHIHEKCDISLYPNPSKKETYFIDLQDGRVLISTLDLNWIESCYHRPPKTVTGCSNCVLHKSCNCTLSSKSFYITNSVHMCSKPETTETKIVPNYLATISYLKTMEPDISLSDDVALDKLSKYSNFSLPLINISRSKWTLDVEKFSTVDSNLDLGHTLNSVRQNKTIYLKPLDAWLDEQTTSALSYTSFGSYISYVLPIAIVVLIIAIVKLYKRQAQINFLIQHLLQGKYSEVIALSTLVNKTEAFESNNDIQILIFDQYFMIMLWIITGLIIIHFIIQTIRQTLKIKELRRKNMQKGLQDQKSWLQMIIGNADRMISVTVCEINLPMNDLLYAQSGDPSFPEISFRGLSPCLKMNFKFLSIASVTNNDIRIPLPNKVPISLLETLRYYYIKQGPANIQVMLTNNNEVKEILLKRLHPVPKYRKIISAWEMEESQFKGEPSSSRSTMQPKMQV